jgi:hypothetical protein
VEGESRPRGPQEEQSSVGKLIATQRRLFEKEENLPGQGQGGGGRMERMNLEVVSFDDKGVLR